MQKAQDGISADRINLYYWGLYTQQQSKAYFCHTAGKTAHKKCHAKRPRLPNPSRTTQNHYQKLISDIHSRKINFKIIKYSCLNFIRKRKFPHRFPFKIIYHNTVLLIISNPVFPNTCRSVFQHFFNIITRPAAGRSNFNNSVRRTFTALFSKLIITAYHTDIRF